MSSDTRRDGRPIPGNFFEDFRIGQEIVHATPRTVTEGDVALYTGALRRALRRRLVRSRSPHRLGLPRAPVDELLAFHLVFGKTVPDISLNAIANLGYADGRFGVPVYPGDTVATTSTVIGAAGRTRTARPASSMCARSARTSAARWCSTTAAG